MKILYSQLDANNAKDPITPKIAHSKKKGKPSKKLTTSKLVDLFKEEDRAAASGFYQRNNTNPSYQERRQSMEDTLSKFMTYSEASHINNSIPRKEKDLGSSTLPCFINNACFNNALVDLGASLADRTMKYPKGIAENVLVGIGKFVFPVDFIILDMPEDIKVPLILGRPFLSIVRAKIDVYKRNITLRVGEERIIFTSFKPASSLIKEGLHARFEKKDWN
ncbi:hypothetical protein Tco_0073325 [Tanacetum coccineum]